MRLRFLVLAFMLAGGPAAAQTIYGFGARLGGTHAQLDGLDFPDFGPRVGILASVFAEIDLLADVTSIAELEFARRGYTFNAWHEDTGEERRAVSSLDFLSVPVLFRIRVDATEHTGFYMMVGPRVDMLVNQTVATISFDDDEIPTRDPLGDIITANVLGGLTVGGGLAVRNVLASELRVDFRYNYSLSDLTPQDTRYVVRQTAIDLALAVVF